MSSRNTYRFRILLLTLLGILSRGIGAQTGSAGTANRQGREAEIGRFPVFNFTPRDYNALEQNWCAVQDNRGIMYFGNNHGILEYDGENWTLIPPRTSSPVKSLAVDENGRIYFGSVGEFGYLAADSLGRLDYFLLSDMLDEQYRDFNVIWKTHASKYGIVYQSYNYLFIWKDDSLRVIPSSEQIHESFYVEGKLFIRYTNSGLAWFDGEKIVPVTGGRIFSDISIYGMLELDPDRILIVTEKHGFYSLLNRGDDPAEAKIGRIFTRNDQLFHNVEIFNAVRINPDRIALGTWGSGTIIIDSLYRVVATIDKSAGLQDQIVQAQYVDVSGKLWLALSSGISRVDVQTPLSRFGDNEGLSGTIQSITRFNGRIFATTNVGLFYMDHIRPVPGPSSFSQAIFRPVEGITSECWDMITFHTAREELLLFATNTDVTELGKDMSADKVMEDYVYKLYQSRLDPNRVYVGLENGLTSIYRKNGQWIKEDRIAGVDEKITSLSEDHVGNLWMGTDDEGVLKLHIRNFDGDRIGEYTVSRYGTESGLPEGPFIISQFRGPPTVATNKGLFKFNLMTESFSPDSSYGDRFANGSLYIHRISEHPEPEIWMVTYSEHAKEFKYEVGYLREKEPSAYTWISEPFRRLSEELIHAIYREPDGIVWLGGSRGLFRYDINHPFDYREDYPAYIRKVEMGGARLLFGGTYKNSRDIQTLVQPASMKPELPYQNNSSLIFNYSAEPGEDRTFTRYSYYLEGNDQSWSEWVPESKKEYTNLREGKYVFHVRARNINWQISREASYEFSILAPWYRKWWAYLMYVLLAGLVVYFIVKVYTRQLRQIIRERTAEVVAQKEVIEEKNKDIMDSIQYAKKIQQALLPPEDDLGKLGVNGFILFLPRDVVSGDFYWLAKQDSKIITVAADCTGHGVPGAFMSMLGVAFLNNIVEVKGIIKALKQKGQEGEQKDGMDIALHVIDYDKMTIEFAGANNPLILIRGGKVTHVKPDRMPIGIHERADESFKNNVMEAVHGDVLYTFSDGYQDQFGGPDNKKFMAKKLKELLLNIHQKPMIEQKKILLQTFMDWINSSNVRQVDDVTVIGIRI
jgi:serine phosphatase RsbU (regulator of sigma subunit)